MKIVSGMHKSMRFAILLLALTGMLGMPSTSSLASAPWKVSEVPLPGVNGESNNVAFAFDRYVLVAPYASTKQIAEDADLSSLDNHILYLFDTKKPFAAPQSIDLKPVGSSKTIFYPTRVVFDPKSQNVYVRGTRFVETEEGFEGIEVLGNTKLNLDDNNKPVFNSSFTVIDIKGVGAADHCSDAPLDFATGQNGSLVVFTNGASIFTYNLDQGYVYKVDIVPAKDFGQDSRITYLDVDDTTNIATVCWNSKSKSEDGNVKTLSELSFYALGKDGSLNLSKRVSSDKFPENASVTPGSRVAISAGSDDRPDFAYFVTNDGTLCQVDLDSDTNVSTSVKQLQKFDEFAQTSADDASPRNVKIDSSKRMVGIVKQGFTAQIRRPSNGKAGRAKNLIRSLSTFNVVESPAFALVKLGNKKGKVTSSTVFADDFRSEEGLTNFAAGTEGQWMISTHSGKLYSVASSDDPQNANLELLVQLGTRTDQIAFCSARSSVVAISSLTSDESGEGIAAPGALIIAKSNDAGIQTSSAMNLFTSQNLLASRITHGQSIRRPCNDKRIN
ncbi:MAG: hypothetical protein WBV94_25355 [Blastocatellia bacterium]